MAMKKVRRLRSSASVHDRTNKCDDTHANKKNAVGIAYTMASTSMPRGVKTRFARYPTCYLRRSLVIGFKGEPCGLTA